MNIHKITKINKNCVRNFLSVGGLCMEIINFITIKRTGIYNIVSTNSVTLDILIKNIYTNDFLFEIFDGDNDILSLQNDALPGENIIIDENFEENIKIDLTKNGTVY